MTGVSNRNMNEAPWPTELQELVATLRYRHGWIFRLANIDRGQGSSGLTLDIITLATDSYNVDVCDTCRSAVTNYRVHHYMPVPPASFDRRSWQRWLFEQVRLVESHEAAEFFRFAIPGEFSQIDRGGPVEKVERPYAPSHGPGNDPYLIREVGTDVDRRTKFTGEINPS